MQCLVFSSRSFVHHKHGRQLINNRRYQRVVPCISRTVDLCNVPLGAPFQQNRSANGHFGPRDTRRTRSETGQTSWDLRHGES